jgi:hypothetical protein
MKLLRILLCLKTKLLLWASKEEMVELFRLPCSFWTSMEELCPHHWDDQYDYDSTVSLVGSLYPIFGHPAPRTKLVTDAYLVENVPQISTVAQ